MGKENFDQNNIPGRVPGTQEQPTVDDSANNANQNSFIKKEVKSKGTVLKQEVIAEALSGKGAGGPIDGATSGTAYGLKQASFSGDTGTILGNASGTPIMGKETQGKSRIDKRLSDANKNINYIASEQIVVGYDMIPALAESKSTVGFNGNPKNVTARMQKKTGATSAELLYDRSLDLITKDAFVYSCGQVVKQEGVEYNDYPTVTETKGNPSETTDFTRVRGNYSPRELEVKFRADGKVCYVSSFKVLEDDFSCNNEKDIIVNGSATHQIIDVNTAELSRQNIDAKAGSPTSEHFNPLGRSVRQPSQTVMYLQDIERVNAAEIFAAIKFANKSRGHYLNRTSKDGQDLVGPGLDALYGHLCGCPDIPSLRSTLSDLRDTFFSPTGMAHGSAALLIETFDSPRKYQTKADLINQARGLKMHLATAANNSGVFQVKKEFVKALNSIDTYSTIDHPYDPTLPVYITDNVRLVHPYSMASMLSYTRSALLADKVFTSDVYSYSYSAGSGINRYQIVCADPLLNGISWFLEQHADSIFKAIGGDINKNGESSEVTLHIPTVHSTTHFSLWDYLICASLPYVIYERTNTMKDILDFEYHYEYPFMGNISIAEANPLAAVNYGNVDPTLPLTIKEMMPSNAMRWRYPETLIRLNSYGLMPFYFNERAFDFTGTTGLNNTLKFNGQGEFSTPVIRSGMKLVGLDEFFGLEVKDQLLLTDRLVRIPGNTDLASFKGVIYKYSQDSDGLIAVHEDYLSTKTVKDWCSTPRLIGMYFDAPQKTCSVISANTAGTTFALGTIPAADSITLDEMAPSFTAIQYRGYYNANETPVTQSLAAGSVNINRAQSFTQTFGKFYAGTNVKSKYFDLVLSVNEAITYNDETATDPRFITLSEKSQFSPFVTGDYSVTDGVADNTAYKVNVANRPIVFSPHAMYWTLLQKTPFVINPFENSNKDNPAADPFGLAYTLGLAGFVSANYDEELYNRANRFLYEGYGYVKDPLIQDSIVFKEGGKTI